MKKTMPRYALIGLGTIALHYKKGIFEQLCAVADIRTDCNAKLCYAEFPFYSNVADLIEKEDFSIAIIATDIYSHVDLALFFLENGKDVMLEKPSATTFEEIEKLYTCAEIYGRNIYAMLHWQFANETIFLSNHLEEFGQVLQVEIYIYDDYTLNGNVRIDKQGLGGCWLDSGINALTFLYSIMDIQKISLIESETVKDTMLKQTIYTKKKYLVNNSFIVTIVVDWTTQSKRKYSVIKTNKGIINIQHNKELIYFNDILVYRSGVLNRLESHYENLFSSNIYNQDAEFARKTYQALFLKSS